MPYATGNPMTPEAYVQQTHSTAVATGYDAALNNWLENTPTITQLMARKGRSVPISTLLRDFGYRTTSTAATVTHWEHEGTQPPLKVTGIVAAAGGAGNPMTVTVDTVNINGAQRSMARERDTWYTPTGVWFYIPQGGVNTNVTPHQVTIRPAQSTIDLDAHIFQDVEYFIRSNANGEGTLTLNPGQERRIDKYTNYWQIIQDAFEATGSSMTLETVVETANGVKLMMMMNQEDAMYVNERNKSHALMFGDTANNLTEVTRLPGNTNVPMTEGFLTFAKRYGSTQGYTIGAYNITNIENILRYYRTQNITDNLMCFDGQEIGFETKRFLKEYVTDTNANLMQMIEGKLGVGVPVEGFTYGGQGIIFAQISEFNAPDAGGGAGYNYPFTRLISPIGMRPSAKNFEDGQKEYPLIGYAVRKNLVPGSRYSERENILVKIDGTGTFTDVTNIEGDFATCGFRSEIAADCNRGNLFIFQEPQ